MSGFTESVAVIGRSLAAPFRGLLQARSDRERLGALSETQLRDLGLAYHDFWYGGFWIPSDPPARHDWSALSAPERQH